LLAPAADPAPAPRAAPTATDVRAAAGKALGFLEASSTAWRADKKCVTCHQVPFTLWAHTEAKARGLAVDGGKLDDLTAWAFNFCATDEHKGEKTGGFHLTSAFLVLSQAGTAPRADALKVYPFFETLFAKRQKADGSWREGNQVKLPGVEREADEVDTMWTLLAIRELERLGDKLPAATHTGLAAERDKGLAFLKGAKAGRRVDWLALRGLVARAYGTAAEADALVAELRGVQNADGGWGYVRGGESYPHTTGEVLFALSSAGADGGDAAVRRAWRYLLAAQRPDGAWDCNSRQSFTTRPDKTNDVTVHWGTGWAALGLVRTLPR
ncbi:MAG TPA: hypothetical protein VD866_13665, partial [Urbifossiella sp.]|nr:hypothetical protein [Urbifossiella sp.]